MQGLQCNRFGLSVYSPPEDQLKIIYDPYCKKFNALTFSTPVEIDCRDYYAIELVYHYSCLGLFDWHGVHVGWGRRAATPSILKTSHLTARRPGFSNVVKGTCAIFFIFFGPMLSDSAPGQKNVPRKSGRHATCSSRPFGPRVAGRFAACNSRETVPCHG